MAIATNPVSSNNPNLLSNVSFNMDMGRFPGMNFYIQSVTLPGVTLSEIMIPTGPARIPYKEISGSAVFEPLSVTFLVDEDMNNYFEIWNWVQIVAGIEADQYSKMLKEDPMKVSAKTDITLHILTSHRNVNIEMKFFDAFPSGVEAMTFDFRSPSVDYQPMTISFSYSHFTFKKK
tara:strand:+ start:851 stop:1378 length:528 start_codon:yes stop_codon:yes gene_type:complete